MSCANSLKKPERFKELEPVIEGAEIQKEQPKVPDTGRDDISFYLLIGLFVLSVINTFKK